MGQAQEVARYVRSLLAKSVTTSLLLLDALIFGLSLLLDSFNPSRWLFLAIAIVAVVAGAFLLHQDQAAAHEDELKSMRAEMDRSRTNDGLARVAESLERVVLPVAGSAPSFSPVNLPPEVDTTPRLEWELQPGKQYEFTLSGREGEDDPLPSFVLTLTSRVKNAGETDVDLLQAEISYRDTMSDRHAAWLPSSSATALPITIPKGGEARLSLAGSAHCVVYSTTTPEQYAARLGKLRATGYAATVEATVELVAVAIDGKQASFTYPAQVSLTPLIDLVFERWERLGRADLFRYAGVPRP